MAKWQIGVRNYLLPVGVMPFAATLLIEMLRRMFDLSIAQLNLSPVMISAAAVYALIILFLMYRITIVANKIKAREFSLSFDGASVVIHENEKAVFAARNEDIKRIDCGANVVRVQTIFGAECVPRQYTPESFVSEMRDKLGREFYDRAWM